MIDIIIISNPMTCVILALIIGLFLGYALSRKQQDKPVIEGIMMTPGSDSIEDDPYYEALQPPTKKGERVGGVE